MFGGAGVFKDGKMIAIIHDDVFYLKANENFQKEFKKYDANQFIPPGMKIKMPYWEVPADILEDKEHLCEWSERAHEIAL